MEPLSTRRADMGRTKRLSGHGALKGRGSAAQATDAKQLTCSVSICFRMLLLDGIWSKSVREKDDMAGDKKDVEFGEGHMQVKDKN